MNKLCKVINMKGEVLLPEESLVLTPREELFRDLNSGKFETVEELLKFIDGKYEIKLK